MPYKDPVKANLQRQRWRELHPEYCRIKSAECEKRNKRWLTKKRKDYMRSWRKANAQKVKTYGFQWRFHNPTKVKESKRRDYLKHKTQILKSHRAYYHKNTSKLLAWQKEYVRQNRSRVTARQREWRLKNIDKQRDKARQSAIKSYYKYLELNRAKAVERVARRTRLINETCEDLQAVKAFIFRLRTDTDVKCTYCGIPIFGTEVHIDHYIPLIMGGRHCVKNLRPACGFCNRSKKDKLPDEFSEYRKYLQSLTIK